MFDGFSRNNIFKIKLLRQTNVNTNIADSISLYFNFRRGYYFVLRVKQQIYDKARFFKMSNVNHVIANWRENDRNLLTPFAIVSNFQGKT